MVVFMEIAGQGNGVASEVCNESSCEASEDFSCRVLENLPFKIAKSHVFHPKEFSYSRMTDGFFGEIYKVQHQRTKQIMVLKVGKPSHECVDCTMVGEIKILQRLSHQHVLRFLGICVDDSRVHLLCEYVNGGDLESLLMDHSVELEWSTRLYLARDIANGMAYLHEQGVIHRDLTSKNCLIKVKNGWRYGIVADLGLATDIKSQSIVGSPYNMAPELLRGEAYDEKADVFSYGIILCEIIGRVHANPDELPRLNTFGLDVEKFQLMVGDCPLEFLQAALCCCQMDPATRPSFGETVKHLGFVLEDYQHRPELDDWTDQTVHQSAHAPTSTVITPVNNVDHWTPHDNNNSPTPPPPAIVISTDHVSPVSTKGSAEKRRQSWISGRHKLFNAATDDLLRNTPSKLKNFFHRILRVHTHFDPSKPRKSKESSKERSSSELRRFSVFGSEENVDQIAASPSGNGESTSISFSYPSSPIMSDGRSSHRSISDLRLSSDSELSEDVVDGRKNRRANTMLSRSVNSGRTRSTSPSELEVTRSHPSSQNFTESETPVTRLLHRSKRVRCQSMPSVEKSSAGPLIRKAVSLKQCESNREQLAPESHSKGSSSKSKQKKMPFKIFRRKSSKSGDEDPGRS